jgi:hypothetical protein
MPYLHAHKAIPQALDLVGDGVQILEVDGGLDENQTAGHRHVLAEIHD